MPGTRVTRPGTPIIHSANSARSQCRPPGPGWAGVGRGSRVPAPSGGSRAGTRSTGCRAGPRRGRRRRCWPRSGGRCRACCCAARAPWARCRCRGWSSPPPAAWWQGGQAGGDDVDQPGLPLWPRTGGCRRAVRARSGAVSPAIGVGSSRAAGHPAARVSTGRAEGCQARANRRSRRTGLRRRQRAGTSTTRHTRARPDRRGRCRGRGCGGPRRSPGRRAGVVGGEGRRPCSARGHCGFLP